jgi:hypothetical protein
MYHQRGSFPVWIAILIGVMLVFGGYYLWRGLIGYFESGANIAAPVIDSTVKAVARATETADAVSQQSAMEFIFPTKTPDRICQNYWVSVVRARVRSCPDQSCDTLDRPVQGTMMCVYRTAKDNPDWYEVDLAPQAPLPRLGYMHNSVVTLDQPAVRPTITFIPFPTVTALPSLTPSQTPVPSATITPNPSFTPTFTDTPSPTDTPLPFIHSA